MKRSLFSIFLISISFLFNPELFAGTTVVQVDSSMQLQSALTAAGTDPEDTLIELAAGDYPTSQVGGSFTYFSDINKSLTLRGAGMGQTVLDGGGTHQILKLSDPNTNDGFIRVENLTLKAGATSTEDGGGAGIHSFDADVFVEGCEFVNNINVGGDGGGLFIASSPGGSISLNGNLFHNNAQVSMPLTDGGGAYLSSGFGQTSLTNNIFFNNFSTRNGGAVYSSSETSKLIYQNTVIENGADSGGGLYLQNSGMFSQTLIFNNILYDNESFAGPDLGMDLFVANNDFEETIQIFFNDIGDYCFENGSCQFGFGVDLFGNLDVAPELQDPDSLNFALASGSPLIDAGTDLVPDGVPTPDFSGTQRPIGAAPDMGALEATPIFDADPNPLDFGTTAQGTTVSLILTLTNQGNAPVDISQASLDNQEAFMVNEFGGDDPCGSTTPNIAGGASCTLEIDFSPEAPGSFTATLTLMSDDPVQPDLMIVLTGTGGSENGSQTSNGCSLTPTASANQWTWASLIALIPIFGMMIRFGLLGSLEKKRTDPLLV